MKETAFNLHWPMLKACFQKSHPQSQHTTPLGCEYYTWKRKGWAWNVFMSPTFRWQKQSLFRVA